MTIDAIEISSEEPVELTKKDQQQLMTVAGAPPEKQVG